MKGLGITIFQYTIRVLAFELGLAILVGGILLIRERSLDSFGNWMIWAGLITLIAGLLSVIGAGSVARSGTYQMGQTVGERDIPDRTNADLAEEQKSYPLVLLSLGVGILAIIIGLLARS